MLSGMRAEVTAHTFVGAYPAEGRADGGAAYGADLDQATLALPQLRRGAGHRAPPGFFRLRPYLLHPCGHRLIVTLQRAAGWDLVRPAVPVQQRGRSLRGVALVEPPSDERRNPGDGPGLVRPPVRDRALVEFLLEHGEQFVAQDRARDRARRVQAGLAPIGPRLVPPLHRPDMHAQLFRDQRGVLTGGEALSRFKSQLLAKRLPLSQE